VGGLDGRWKETAKIHNRFCQIILEVLRFAENNLAELELGRNSTRGRVLSTISNY
jgi:hypothetical protein